MSISAALLFGSDTPTKVVYQFASCPTGHNQKAESVQVLGTHRWARGVVVLYSALCSSGDRKTTLKRIVGHEMIERQGRQWHVSGGDSYRVERSSREKLIDYRLGISQGVGGDRYAILYGQFLSPKVKTVEATFNNGEILRHQGDAEAFVMVAPGATTICELRILGEDNKILRQENLTRPDPAHQPKTSVSYKFNGDRCLAIPHAL
jgi:hypothetical protein